MLYRLLSHDKETHFDHAVVSLMGPGRLSDGFRARGVPVTYLGLKRGQVSLDCAQRLRRLGRTLTPDLVVGWMYHGNLAASWLRRWAPQRPPLVWNIHHTLHRLGDERRLTQFVIKAGALLSRSPAAIVYVAEVSARSHEDHGYSNIHRVVIPNGFDCDTFRSDDEARRRIRAQLGIANDTPTIGIFGRAHADKDYGSFFAALARAQARMPRLVALAAGAGVTAANQDLQAGIPDCASAGQLCLLGEREDVADLMNAVDVVVLSSRTEAFPLVIGEAMACGVPCVTTDVGAAAELVGDTGKVVPSRDPQALAEAIVALLAMPYEERRELGRQGRRRIIERYGLPDVVDKYHRLWASLVGRRTNVTRDEGGRDG